MAPKIWQSLIIHISILLIKSRKFIEKDHLLWKKTKAKADILKKMCQIMNLGWKIYLLKQRTDPYSKNGLHTKINYKKLGLSVNKICFT